MGRGAGELFLSFFTITIFIFLFLKK